MMKLQQETAYLCEYDSKNCDIRFYVTLKTKTGETAIKESLGFCKVTDTLAVLKKDIQDRLLGLNLNNTENNVEVLYNLPESGSDIPVAFLNAENKPYADTKPILDFLKLTGKKKLKVLSNTFRIVHNAPIVRVAKLPLSICVNFSVEPVIFKSYFLDKDASQFIWSKSKDQIKWSKVGEGFLYEVQESDLGHFLKFCCIPYSNNSKVKGPIYESISEYPVEKIKKFPQCPFEERHKLINQKLNGNKFRVVSYNVLADRYVDNIQYDYCNPRALGIHYRKQLIIKELEGFKSDIICLQEVDETQYKKYYKQAFHDRGYHSVFNRKGNCIPEGLLCAFNANRYKLLESKQIVLRSCLDRRQFKIVKDLLDSNAEVKNEFIKQNTSLQTTVLQDKSTQKIVIVGNTHLFYHPDADHIRILQACMATQHLEYLKSRLLRELKTQHIGVVFCGDFNSDVSKSLYDFMIVGTMDPEHKDCLKILPTGDAVIYHKLRLVSASGTPKFTNYTSTYKGCLDYIFVDTLMFSVIRTIPVPSPSELEQYVGLPNDVYPSDHLSLVVELQFRSK